MLRVSLRLTAIAAFIALTACGGGGGGGGSLPSTAVPGKTPHSSAALSFFIPSASTPSARRRPAYLPSTTASIVVDVVNGDGTPLSPPIAPTVANVSPTASGCQAVSGGLQCTVSVSVTTGSLLFVATAYDQANGAGDVLATGETAATIGSGANNLSIVMAAGAVYAAVGLDGNIQIITIDHQNNTFAVQGTVGSIFTTAGTFTNLPNGDMKFVVTSSTDSSVTSGTVAYARELANGALMYVVTGTATPSADGSSTTDADWGVGTALQPCLPDGSFGFTGVSIGGPAFDATTTAYTTGTAMISGNTLTFTGTNFLFNSTPNGSANSAAQTCTNGIYTATNQGSAVPGLQGLVVVSDDSGGNAYQSTDTGGVGFIPPAQPLDLADIASKSYEAFQGVQAANGTMVERFEAPGTLTPGGGMTLTACQYVNFEANSVESTGCDTITLTGQPLPGLITGTDVNTTGTTPFIAIAGKVDGKYMLVVLSDATGGGVNVVAMQH